LRLFNKILGISIFLPAILILWSGELRLAEAQKPPDNTPVSDKNEIQVPPPPFSEGIFPCTDCHVDLEVDKTRRELTEEHDGIVLNHGEKWCFDCHNPDDRDYLRLADGQLIDFKESYILCGQCHGPKLRDWKLGIHGKRTGQWDGQKKYLLCAHCHNPHHPRFEPVTPLPPPVRPENLRP
jgi:hypothetical protein